MSIFLSLNNQHVFDFIEEIDNFGTMNKGKNSDLQDLQDLQVLKEDYETLNSLIKICPEHLSSKYKQMLHNIKNKKSNTVMPPKSLFYKMMQVYNSTNDDIIKYEIDKFLYE